MYVQLRKSTALASLLSHLQPSTVRSYQSNSGKLKFCYLRMVGSHRPILLLENRQSFIMLLIFQIFTIAAKFHFQSIKHPYYPTNQTPNRYLLLKQIGPIQFITKIFIPMRYYTNSPTKFYGEQVQFNKENNESPPPTYFISIFQRKCPNPHLHLRTILTDNKIWSLLKDQALE